MIYQMQEGYLTLEGEWRDQSMNVLVHLNSPNQGINIVVARDILPEGMAFSDYIDQQKSTFEKELTKLDLILDKNDDLIGNQTTHFLEFKWENQGNPLHQIMGVVLIDDQIISITATIPGIVTTEIRNSMYNIVKNYKTGINPDLCPSSEL